MKEEVCRKIIKNRYIKELEDLFGNDYKLKDLFGNDYIIYSEREISGDLNIIRITKPITEERTIKTTTKHFLFKKTKEEKYTMIVYDDIGDIDFEYKTIKVYKKEAYEILKSFGEKHNFETLIKCWDELVDEDIPTKSDIHNDRDKRKYEYRYYGN